MYREKPQMLIIDDTYLIKCWQGLRCWQIVGFDYWLHVLY